MRYFAATSLAWKIEGRADVARLMTMVMRRPRLPSRHSRSRSRRGLRPSESPPGPSTATAAAAAAAAGILVWRGRF